MPAPRVHAYIDYRTFLRDWLEARKQVDPDYSYTTFAEAARCAKSSLANAISGARRPRPDTLDAFAVAMELSPAERNYLGLLVDLAAAPTVDERMGVMTRIVAAERHEQVRIAENRDHAELFQYLEHWYIPAILEMVGRPGFREDPEWIAAQLQPKVTPAEAQETLDLLSDLRLVKRDEDGRLQPQTIQFRTESETRVAAAHHYHSVVIPGLLQQLDGTQWEQQHVMAATVTLPPELVPEAKAKLTAVMKQLTTLADDREAKGPRRVYQVAVQLLPLTGEIS